ncbi:MAG TPA: hypothetical protein PLS49_04230, partial [Candidatus Woesebacteria bacterium]|nr:hypothetical protein [Candidatus Woesebacteria bacterium]
HNTKELCPYCWQSLSGSDYAKLYEEYFNQEYKESLKALHQYKNKLKNDINTHSIVAQDRIITENEKRFSYWKGLSLTDLQDSQFKIDELHTLISELAVLVEEILQEKLQNPLTKIAIHAQLNEAIKRLQDKLKEIERYNMIIKKNNEITAKYKAQIIQADNTAILRDKLNTALDQQTRYTPAVEILCKNYQSLLGEKLKQEQLKSSFREELDNESEQILLDHQNSINECLQKFGALFSIQRIERDHIGGKPNSTFVIEINGEEIAADSQDENSPNFKTILSSGDKTTLALAFFVSSALQDIDLNSTILVVDDTINSMDYGRRMYTARTVLNLFSKCYQGFLFSHDPDFLHLVWSNLDNNRASFQIKRNGQRTSHLKLWNVEKHAESEQKERIAILQKYIDYGLTDNTQPKQIIEIIRPTLEHAYKALYPKEFPSSATLGEFIGNIRTSNENYLVNIKMRIDRLDAINDYVTPYSSHDPSSTTPQIEDSELLTFVKDALNIIRS